MLTNKKNQLKMYIKQFSTVNKLPNGTLHKVLSVKNTKLIANILKIQTIAIEIEALKNNIIPKRYARNMNSLSLIEQIKLLNTHVCIVGIGGLGGTVLENLTRIGIGHITIIDGDCFEDSNLNRQLLSSSNTIGQYKTDIAVQHVSQINTSTLITQSKKYLTKTNSEKLMRKCNIIVDCLDNIKSRFILESKSQKLKLPLVSAGIAGTIGYVSTIFPEDSGLKLIFGEKSKLKQNQGEEVRLGCLAHTTSIIGSLECNEIIKITLNKKTLRNKILLIDLETYIFEIFNLKNKQH